jgi:DnaJ-class molecular chaperone
MALRTQSVMPILLLRYQQLVRSLSTHKASRKQEGEQQKQCPIKAEATAYEVLGLPESCTEALVRANFRKLAKATHPDLQTDTSTAYFIRILAAYEVRFT